MTIYCLRPGLATAWRFCTCNCVNHVREGHDETQQAKCCNSETISCVQPNIDRSPKIQHQMCNECRWLAAGLGEIFFCTTPTDETKPLPVYMPFAPKNATSWRCCACENLNEIVPEDWGKAKAQCKRTCGHEADTHFCPAIHTLCYMCIWLDMRDDVEEPLTYADGREIPLNIARKLRDLIWKSGFSEELVPERK